MAQLPSLLGFDHEQLAAALTELGEQKGYRVTQLQESSHTAANPAVLPASFSPDCSWTTNSSNL